MGKLIDQLNKPTANAPPAPPPQAELVAHLIEALKQKRQSDPLAFFGYLLGGGVAGWLLHLLFN
jgi:hypothetical protein